MTAGSVLPRTTLLLSPNPWDPGSPGRTHLARPTSMNEFKQAHARAIKLGEDDDPLRTSHLIKSCALSPWGSPHYATSIFLNAASPTTKDFNFLLRGHVLAGNPISALLLFNQIKVWEEEEGMIVNPDEFTFVFLLNACARTELFDVGRQIQALVYKYGVHLDVTVQNSLINLYGRCGAPEIACQVFEEMPTRTVASWSSLMAALNRAQEWENCVLLLRRMALAGVLPEESCLNSAVVAAGNVGFLGAGRGAHGRWLRISGDRRNVELQTSLVDMYMRCGRPDTALKVFGEMAERNLWTYTVAISGLAASGRGEAAVELFDEMVGRGIQPDAAAFAAVLTACARNGLVEEGRHRFSAMAAAKTKQHYACMVDLLARGGMVEEALWLAMGVPEQSHDALWRSLLSACRDQSKLEIGLIAGKKLVEMGSDNAADYIMLSELYMREGSTEAAATTRRKMAEAVGVQRVGMSILEGAGGQRHRFVSQDRRHPENRRILEMVKQVEWQMRFEGHEEEEEARGHSLKLAICFGLISSCSAGVIRIVRNLRMCRDCHAYGKLVSKIYEREIIVREPGRFHRFKDGSCSCGDYW
ncbi:tetratricopeptide repeat (TPR)-like superfamily protein [Wolffia australiana]